MGSGVGPGGNGGWRDRRTKNQAPIPAAETTIGSKGGEEFTDQPMVIDGGRKASLGRMPSLNKMSTAGVWSQFADYTVCGVPPHGRVAPWRTFLSDALK